MAESNIAHTETPRHTVAAKAASALQSIANLAVIGLCVVVGWMAFHRGTQPGNAQPPSPPIYKTGEQIDPVPGVNLADTRETLVMVLREDCHYCQESLPFYRELSEARRKHPDAGVKLVVASTDSDKTLQPYLQSKGVLVDHVSTISAGDLKVPGTPMLLRVNQSGKILNIWRGRLGDGQQKEVLKTLGLALE